MQLEWIIDDRADLICTLIANLNISKKKQNLTKNNENKLSNPSKNMQKIMENAAIIIQKFYRKRKRRILKKKAYIAEYVIYK